MFRSSRAYIVLTYLVGFFFWMHQPAFGKDLPVFVSELSIEWNQETKVFEALFKVSNLSGQDTPLTCILRFQSDKKRRWRGVKLPVIPRKSSKQFKISVPPELMLKDDYTDISVLVYHKDYSGYLDKTSNYARVQSSHYLEEGAYQVRISKQKVSEQIDTPLFPQEKNSPDLAEDQPVQSKQSATTVTIGTAASFAPKVERYAPEKVELKPVSDDSSITGLSDKDQLKDSRIGLLTERDQGTRDKKLDDATIQQSSDKAKRKGPQIKFFTPQLELVNAVDSKVDIRWHIESNHNRFALYWSDMPLITRENSTRVVVEGNRYSHDQLVNGTSYYYVVAMLVNGLEGKLSNEIEATPYSTAVVETPIPVLLTDVHPDDFSRINPIQQLLIDIADRSIAREETLKRARALEALDIQSREELISLFIAEGKSERVAKVLADQLDKNPENLDLSLSLSKVYHEQGDTKAALNVLNASLEHISLSARLALNEELKTSVKKGETTLVEQSEESFLANEFSKLGLSLLDSAKYTDALSAFQSLHSLVQDYPFLQYYMGRCRQALKQYNQAKRLYMDQSKQALELERQITNLKSLVDVLHFAVELNDINYTIEKYQLIAESVEASQQSHIQGQLVKLENLVLKAKTRLAGNLPDLVVSLPEEFQLENIQPGQDIVVQLAVANIGKRSSSDFSVYYQLKHESGIFFEIPESDRFKGLEAGSDTISWNKRVSVPVKAVKGKYQLVINVEQAEGADEITLSNNMLLSSASIDVIPPISDLALTFREKPAQMRVQREEGIKVDLVAANNGFLPSPPFQIEYLMITEEGETFPVAERMQFRPLQKRDRMLLEGVSVKLPEEFIEGVYNLRISMIPDKSAAEINKENNVVETGFIIEIPDRFEGRIEEGIAYYKEKIKTEPEIMRNRVKLSRYYQELEIDDEALSVLNLASVHAADQQQTPSGSMQKQENKLQKRDLNWLKKELRVFGDRLYQEKNYQDALTSYQSLQTLDSDYPYINRLIGDCRIELGQYSLAKDEYYAQVIRTQDMESLSDLKAAVSVGSDIDFMRRTKTLFEEFKSKHPDTLAEQVDEQIDELEQLIERTNTQMAQQGSDLIIAIENPPAQVALKPKDLLELEFSIANLGNSLSNPVTVHYQFIHEDGNVYDADTATAFDRLDPKDETVFWDEDLIVPENIIGGQYQIRAVMEFDKNMSDKDENNNQVVSELLFVYNEPDLAIINFSHRIRKILQDKSVITAQLMWENQGGNPATDNRLSMFLENLNESSDRIEVSSTVLQNVPPLSKTIAMAYQLEIPRIQTDATYKLVAEIRSEGGLKENRLLNNRFESSELIGKDIAPVVITQINLNTKLSYPGKQVDLEVWLRNNQLNKDIKNAVLEFSLLDQKGHSCCAVQRKVDLIPPSIVNADDKGNIDVTDFVFKDKIEFPGITQGSYRVEVKLVSTEQIERIEASQPIQSITSLQYGNPTFRVTNFYPVRDILIPGKETLLNVTVLNNGKDRSKPEILHLFLDGENSIPIGSIEIESLEPFGQSVTLNKSVAIPKSLARGTYVLTLRKDQTIQSESQVIRYRNPVTIHEIQPIAPQEFEAFRQNEIPLFSWNSIDNLSYQLMFSTDPAFADDSQIFRVPSEDWLTSKQYRPLPGEWNLIWLLSQSRESDIYWQIEAKSEQEGVITGMPQKILFNREQVN